MRKVHRIRTHELGLRFRHGELQEVVGPGKHTLWSIPFRAKDTIEVVDTLRPRVEHDRLDAFVRDERLAARLTVVDLKDDERALVWLDGRLGAILAPGVHAFWNGAVSVEVERHSVNSGRFEHPRLESILNFPGGVRYFEGVRVDANERVMLYRDGELADQLGPGHYVFWRGGPAVTWKSVDLREQIADIQGQEIMTADKVTLRMNLVVTHRVTDPAKAVTEVESWSQSLYREAQLGLRAAVGGRTLDKLLSDKDGLGGEVREHLVPRAAAFGVEVASVGLRDIILPGEMKSILNEVILAQKQAEANLIRRREETAAARSQANTAKVLADNPVLARMKELEALADILRGTEATFVLGSGDLSEQIGSLFRKELAKP